jgi:hypothetical protein
MSEKENFALLQIREDVELDSLESRNLVRLNNVDVSKGKKQIPIVIYDR